MSFSCFHDLVFSVFSFEFPMISFAYSDGHIANQHSIFLCTTLSFELLAKHVNQMIICWTRMFYVSIICFWALLSLWIFLPSNKHAPHEYFLFFLILSSLLVLESNNLEAVTFNCSSTFGSQNNHPMVKQFSLSAPIIA